MPQNKPAHAEFDKPTNAEIIAELTRAKVAFQLATICAVMGITETPEGETP